MESENRERRERVIWRGFGERERERERKLGMPFLYSYGAYIIRNYENFCPQKFSLPRKRLGYDARMSSSIS